MWIKTLSLENIRSFENASLEFSNTINILIGRNNAGKSSILLPLLSLQSDLPLLSSKDLRIGTKASRAEITFASSDTRYFPDTHGVSSIWYDIPGGGNQATLNTMDGKAGKRLARISNKEPNNFIYPFISKRKVTALSEQINDQTVHTIPSTFENLNSKIDRLSSPEFLPAHILYMRACDEILGFRVTTAHSAQGKQAVYTVGNMQTIPLSSMGEGVMNILGLVVHLALAENKLFLIEEPENDIHPKALKALMDLILEKAATNQFIITTHSNIVLKKLGSLETAKIFALDLSFKERLPTSAIREVGGSTDERRTVLEDLGYELNDTDLWQGWLLLEESSAEKIIREYLIPWFAPGLGSKLRTFSAHSVSEVEVRFQDFNELFVFLHLEPVYFNRAWVIIDAGPKEKGVIETIKSVYSKRGWHDDQFRQFSKHDFEEYYPLMFAPTVTEIANLTTKQAKRKRKKELLDTVEGWIKQDKEAAKAAFQESASEVIAILIEIATKIARSQSNQ